MNWTEISKQFLYNPEAPLLFHQGFFLFIFALFLIGYSFVTKSVQKRQVLIILFSAYFYYKASGIFLLLLLATISIDYVFSILIERQKDDFKSKLLVFFGISFSLSFLLYFKYKNFFLENTSFLFGSNNYSFEALILPIGISFYTFQSISYLVDIHKLKVKRPAFTNYLMYMMFFPHLVAGPIVRAKDFLPQLTKKFSLKKSNLNEALYLITKGLIKKAIFADFIAQYSDIVFSAPEGFSGTEHVLAGLCYTMQIFFDFSGYTDMAIGIALLLGYRLCLNFDSPYKAKNITDFWRRWHISLSTWLRDYIYIPLGGNRRGVLLQLLFLLTTMLIGGFWHGADWKFIFWGGAHGLLLILHKLWKKYTADWNLGVWFTYFSWLITFSCVALLWIPFRANSMDEAFLIYSKIFTNFNVNMIQAIFVTNPVLIVVLFIGIVLAILPSIWKNQIIKSYFKLEFYQKMIFLILVIQVVIQMKTSTVQPFIYFQF